MRNGVTCVLLVIATGLGPVSASATTWGAEVFGAFNSFAMDDVNTALAADNSNGANYDDISSEYSGGLALRVWANPNWLFSLGWEPLFAETKSDASGATGTWNLDAQSIQLSGAYIWTTAGPVRYGLGAGLGFYSVSGENQDPSAFPTTLELKGDGLGFHVMGLGEWAASDVWGVTAGLGYRGADIELDGSSNQSTADYSGFTGRLGLAFHIRAAQ